MNCMKNLRSLLVASSLFTLTAAGFCYLSAKPEMVAAAQVSGAAAARKAAHTPAVPIPKNHIYDETADPKAQIAAALKQARRERKRVILDFGGDWCGDCQVLYYYLHKAPNEAILEKNYIVVPIWVGRRIELNRDIAAKYGVNLGKGVPALSVIDAKGKVIHAQAQGEFSDMRYMDEKEATQFLEQWKA